MTALTANVAILAPVITYNFVKVGDTKGNIPSSEDAVTREARKVLLGIACIS